MINNFQKSHFLTGYNLQELHALQNAHQCNHKLYNTSNTTLHCLPSSPYEGFSGANQGEIYIEEKNIPQCQLKKV